MSILNPKSMQINCIIIDDEPLARVTIEDYIKKFPFLNLVGRFENPLEAMAEIEKSQIDLIFSDIHMPELTGIEFLKLLKDPPYVIFITAYPNHAVEGFELEVLDYIIKPFSLERFTKAINRAKRGMEYRFRKTDEDEYLKIKDGSKTVFLKYSDIYYVEGMKDYVKIYNKDKPVVTMATLKAMEERLPSDTFIRVQKSFIINKDMIISVDATKVLLNPSRLEIPIGLLYRSAFFKKINL